ncbi:MAG: HAD-IA family hydrolase [Gammaproteobacteria bacterium]|nr:HAD-IA family hydrolase [Gammaproteobacteria bacterium]
MSAASARAPGPFRLLVFDWDGTLADSERRIVATARAAIAALGLPPRSDEAIRHVVGLGLAEAFQALYPDLSAEACARAVAGYRQRWVHTAGTPVPLFPGALDALHELGRSGFLLAVATGKSRRGLARDLESHGLAELFAETRSADDAPSKPHPQMLLDIMSVLDVGAAETLMIGDTAYDLEMARNAGVACAAVSCGMHAADALLEYSPLAVLESVAGLPPWLARI